jgi:hypothetical protein
MNICVRPFTEEWIPQVKAFNQRLLAGGLDPQLAFPETPFLDFPARGALIWQEPFLAIEDGTVRGAYYFTHERYAIRGEVCWVAHYRHPISEVVVNKTYKGLSSQLLADARQRQPLLYGTGLGGQKGPNLRRLRAERWMDIEIPFFFRVVHPAVFFRNVAILRKTLLRRLLFDMATFSGTGWLGIKTLQTIQALGGKAISGYSSEIVPEFGAWADELWAVNQPLDLLAAVRDRAALNLRYSPQNPRFRRVKVSCASQVAGWALLLDKKMDGNPYFGNMHVGTIVDCLATPGHELAVVRAASVELESAGVDILVSNQSAARWCTAFRRSGFLSGPSNYIFAVSAELSEKLHPFLQNGPKLHVNRGDGAGTSRL